jgi:hypothetical protein
VAKRINELFIGKDFLNIEGRTIKHPALIKVYASANINKTRTEPLSFMGLDLETNHITAELKLLGWWNGTDYAYYTDNFLSVFMAYLKYIYEADKCIAYWNKLDPFVIYKQFLNKLPQPEQDESLNRYGKISGEWDTKNARWMIPPVIEVIDDYTSKRFGIKQVIRSSLQFFYYNEGDEKPKEVWAYDIAQLYEYALERECLGPEDEDENGNKLGTYSNARLSYYTKLGEEYHKIDWERFNTDKDFHKGVLFSNQLDARAVYDLANNINDEFKRAFGYYPKTLISTGSIARSAIVATLMNKYSKIYDNEKELKSKVKADTKAIGFLNFYDENIKFDGLRDLYALCCEAYSGGYIEAIRYGVTNEAYYADIASAYPAFIKQLYDLRGATITSGTGEPPHIENSYCFIRGTVDIPAKVNFHPITVKHPVNKDTNIRAVGRYIASYTLEERDFLIEQGAKFKNETWYNIKTSGALSPLAQVATDFIDLRTELRKQNDTAQYMAKIAVNSIYGVLFEAVDTYERTHKEVVLDSFKINDYSKALSAYKKGINLSNVKSDLKYLFDTDYKKVMAMWHNPKCQMYPDTVKMKLSDIGIHLDSEHPADIIKEIDSLYRGEKTTTYENKKYIDAVERSGYRAGEFFNPLYAAIITSRTRLLIAKNATAIEKRGGKVILIMTDSIFWTGKPDMINADDVRELKTVGYFEKPTKVRDLVCLGSGRYSFKDEKGDHITSKNRGLNAIDFHNPNGVILDDFNWMNALKIARHTKSNLIEIKVRTLISVGMILNNKQLTYHDLGRVIEDIREVDLIVGKTKRFFDGKLKDPDVLANGLVNTYPIDLDYGIFGEPELNDQTLPQLRAEMMKYEVMSLKDKKKASNRKSQAKYQKQDHVKYKNNSDLKLKYQQLKDKGYTAPEARRMSKWSMDKIIERMLEDNRI